MTGPQKLERLETLVVQLLDRKEQGDTLGEEILVARLRDVLKLPKA